MLSLPLILTPYLMIARYAVPPTDAYFDEVSFAATYSNHVPFFFLFPLSYVQFDHQYFLVQNHIFHLFLLPTPFIMLRTVVVMERVANRYFFKIVTSLFL